MKIKMTWWKQIGLWIAALILTIASFIFQRVTGPTQPVAEKIDFNGSPVSFEFERSHITDSDQPIQIWAPDTSITGTLIYRRHRSFDEWTAEPLQRFGEVLASSLPKQPAAGKIAYWVELQKGKEQRIVPTGGTLITRFRGAVPNAILIPHILFVFLFFLLAIRTGLEALSSAEHLFPYVLWTLVFLVIGGMIMGPIVQKFAFDAYWTGFPMGTDLTDNKTLVALIAWIIALVMIQRQPRHRGWVLAAVLITLVVFLIPHSLLGSELDYSQLSETLP
ncbi:hypothetical protein JW992_11640 [candidate division KSB1 bacterium]|nr:hypothetical protein [candidate division KSB1 bacterium]